MRNEFKVHLLNQEGVGKANKLAETFSSTLDQVEEISGKEGREAALVRTHLEMASYYAKRAMAQRPENQGAPQSGKIENVMDAMDSELTQIKNLLTAAGVGESDGAGGYVGPAQRLRMLLSYPRTAQS